MADTKGRMWTNLASADEKGALDNTLNPMVTSDPRTSANFSSSPVTEEARDTAKAAPERFNIEVIGERTTSTVGRATAQRKKWVVLAAVAAVVLVAVIAMVATITPAGGAAAAGGGGAPGAAGANGEPARPRMLSAVALDLAVDFTGENLAKSELAAATLVAGANVKGAVAKALGVSAGDVDCAATITDVSATSGGRRLATSSTRSYQTGLKVTVGFTDPSQAGKLQGTTITEALGGSVEAAVTDGLKAVGAGDIVSNASMSGNSSTTFAPADVATIEKPGTSSRGGGSAGSGGGGGADTSKSTFSAKGMDTECTQDAQCKAFTVSCVDPGPHGRCGLKANEVICSGDSSCLSGRCTNRGLFLYRCEAQLPDGRGCDGDTDCESGNCVEANVLLKTGICGLKGNGVGCFSNGACQSNRCDMKGAKLVCQGKLPDQADCNEGKRRLGLRAGGGAWEVLAESKEAGFCAHVCCARVCGAAASM